MKKDKTMSIRMEHEVYNRLLSCAKSLGTTQSRLVRLLIVSGLRKMSNIGDVSNE